MEKIFGQLTSAPLNETGPVRLWLRQFGFLNYHDYGSACYIPGHRGIIAARVRSPVTINVLRNSSFCSCPLPCFVFHEKRSFDAAWSTFRWCVYSMRFLTHASSKPSLHPSSINLSCGNCFAILNMRSSVRASVPALQLWKIISNKQNQ